MSYNDQLVAYHLEIARKRAEANSVSLDVHNIEASDLNGVKGLGKASIEKLREAGISSKSQLLSADTEVLKKALNPITLKQVLTFIKENGSQNRN